MDSSTITALTNALDFGSAKLSAISNNLSNINTPGYKRKDAEFAAFLNSAAGYDETVAAKQTDARHMDLDGDASANAHPKIVASGGGAMRMDGNNVDIDVETTRLAAAEIYYQGASQLISGQFAGLKYAISGGR